MNVKLNEPCQQLSQLHGTSIVLADILDQLSPTCSDRLSPKAGSLQSPSSPVSHAIRNICNQPYNIMHTIGEGSYGKVKLAVHKLTGEHVAIKCLNKAQIARDKSSAVRIAREINTNRLLSSHPHVVPLLQVIDTNMALMLVFCYEEGGDLYDYVIRKGRLSERRARLLFKQIVETVLYFHENGIVHRDLKPENMLLDKSGNIVKIIDYGFVNAQTPGNSLTTFCGSMAYAAPEMLSGGQYQGFMVDTWSLGVTLYLLVTGHLPFEESSPSALYTLVANGCLNFPSYVSSDVADLIHQMLKVNVEQRTSLQMVLQHSWLTTQPSETIHITHSMYDVSATLIENIFDEMMSLGFSDRPGTRDLVLRCVPSLAFATFVLLKQKHQQLLQSRKSPSNVSAESLLDETATEEFVLDGESSAPTKQTQEIVESGPERQIRNVKRYCTPSPLIEEEEEGEDVAVF